jgi:hypothetical protein
MVLIEWVFGVEVTDVNEPRSWCNPGVTTGVVRRRYRGLSVLIRRRARRSKASISEDFRGFDAGFRNGELVLVEELPPSESERQAEPN